MRKASWIAGLAVVIVGAVIGYVFLIGTPKILPPTGWSLGTHPETWPQSRILDERIPLKVQEHIMEHDRGTNSPPGIIIQYNCSKYSCGDDLVQKLEDIVREYPTRVYLAPFPKMGAKIVLTTFKKREILEEFDENRIVEFIESAPK